MSERVQGVTALLGRTAWGPVSTPTVIHSEAGFAQVFGGAGAAVGGAVRDLLQGGGPVVVVRLFNADDARRRFETEVAIWGEAPWRRPVRAALSACLDGALGLPVDELEQRLWRAAAGFRGPSMEASVVPGLLPRLLAPLTGGARVDAEALGALRGVLDVPDPYDPLFILDAANPGSWGDALHAWVDFPPGAGDAFDLHVALVPRSGDFQRKETHRGVSLRPDAPRPLGPVLAAESALVRLGWGRGVLDRTSAPGGHVLEPAADSAPLGAAQYAAGLAALGEGIGGLWVPPDGGDPAARAEAEAWGAARGVPVRLDAPPT